MAIQLKKSRSLESLSMTPLIDVVFILLIFFLVAAKFANEDRQLAVQLPSASSAVPMTVEPQVLIIGIQSDGAYSIDGVATDIATLESTLKSSIVNNPNNQSVIIRGDKRVSFEYVVAAMDMCVRLKVPSYKVTTDGDK